jgi:hypothetical protein
MQLGLRQAPGFVLIVMLTAGTGWAQVKPACDSQGRVKSPEMVEGHITNIDRSNGKLSVRTSGGKEYEFLASNETLQDYKVGDPIKAKLREAPKCDQK